MHTPKAAASQTHALELGFAALDCSSEMGDYIGMESCVDLEVEHNEDMVSTESNRQRRGGGKRYRRWEMKKKEEKEYPPPIPLLARTENLPSHMPWVMKRYYTSDGRLIIKEEKVRHHEYFRAHRANGRLTLQLVPLDDDVLALHPDMVGLEEEDVVEQPHDDNDVGGGDEAIRRDRTVVDSSSMDQSAGTVLMGGGAAGGKCYKYNSTASCIFGMSVAAIRPVRI